jgi:hypothetical protein
VLILFKVHLKVSEKRPGLTLQLETLGEQKPRVIAFCHSLCGSIATTHLEMSLRNGISTIPFYSPLPASLVPLFIEK